MPVRKDVIVLLLWRLIVLEGKRTRAIRFTAQDESWSPGELGEPNVGDAVNILTGKYKTCTGEVVQLKPGKAKVLRRCPHGPLRFGDGKTWWYGFHQIEIQAAPPFDEDAMMVDEDAMMVDEDTMMVDEVSPVQQQDPTANAWVLSPLRDAKYAKDHPLCHHYSDLPPVNQHAQPPVLGNRLVVRRGKSFIVGLGGQVPLGATAQFVFLKSGNGVPADVVSNAAPQFSSDRTFIQVSTDQTFPVGEYELRVRSGSFHTALGVVVLFNPFTCSGCPEYAPTAQRNHFLEEYVGGQEGLLWQGLSDDFEAHVWTYDPFRAANLLISIALLRDLSLQDRADPTKVSRHLSHVIGDKVCYGKWGEGNYASGKPPGGYRCQSRVRKESFAQHCTDPSVWTSSTPILEQHWALVQKGSDATSVQYCQCFVFAGVTTTVGRSLGLGTRPVTNFQSAHDTKLDRSIHKFYFSYPDGAWDPVDSSALCPGWCLQNPASRRCNAQACVAEVKAGVGFGTRPECVACMPCVPCMSRHDSVWSFHVWNEMYFDRADVVSANGWQAVDATPQEESRGRYQMGPAPLRHVKESKSACYDADFVIGEVNADVKLFVYQLPDKSEASKVAAIDNGNFILEACDPLFYGTRWQNDPFEDHFNTIGFRIITKKPGPISQACRQDPDACSTNGLDVTRYYKKCPSEATGGRACGADAKPTVPQLCAPFTSLLELSPSLNASYTSSFNKTAEVQPMSIQVETRSLNAVSQERSGGDITADFSNIIAKGPVRLDTPIDIRASFTNTGASNRNVHVSMTLSVCDNRGKRVRISDSGDGIPLTMSGESLVAATALVPPMGSVPFTMTINLSSLLHDDIRSKLEQLAGEGTFFVMLHFKGEVKETSQVLLHEPRRRLKE